MSADLPLPEGPEIMVKLPRSIFKSIPESIGIDVGQEKEAFLTSNPESVFWQFRVLYESTSGLERYSTSLLRLVKPLTRMGRVTGKIERHTANWLNKAKVEKISPDENSDSLSKPEIIQT